MQPMLNIAVSAARAAGKIMLRHSNRLEQLKVETKRPNDFVTEVDYQAEKEIMRIIKRAYPGHSMLSEESGTHAGNDYQWIIDPLDGTTNFLHGIPQYAVSIALHHRQRPELGVVYDPIKEELFCASRGQGATLNNRRIRVSRRPSLAGALLGTGIPYRPDHDLAGYLDTLKGLLPGTAGVRRAGAASLDLAYVAAGRLDGFWEFALSPWDMAAGIVLVQEAGGLVGDARGGHEFMTSGDILVANPKLFREMAAKLRPLLPQETGGQRRELLTD